MFYVYILKWNKKHYIWYTNNLERRVNEHKRWQTTSTKQIKTYLLVWYFIKNTRSEAIKLENIIKRNWHIKNWINHNTFVLLNKDM